MQKEINMPISVFLFMNFIVAASAFLLTYRIFRFGKFTDSVLSWFILYFAQIVVTEELLGVFNILYLQNVILLNAAILLFVWLITKNRESAFVPFPQGALSQLLNNKVVFFATAILFGFGLTKTVINLVNPPFGWDNLNYHFTFPVEWLKHGNLNTPITVFDDPGPSYYPVSGSLFFLWLMFPLKNVFLADLGQIPFFIVAFLAAYSLGRKIGLAAEMAYFSACLFTLIPNYFKQIEVAYVDVMVAALFLTALNFQFLIKTEWSLKNIMLYSLSLGLLLGTKTVALPYSAILFLPVVYLSLKNIKKFHFILFSLAALIAFGGFSYIRNFIDTGNPLYPFDFQLFGRNIFRGVIDSATYRAHFKIEDYGIGKMLFHEGLGAQSLIFILPSVFLALPFTLAKNRKALNFNLVYFLLLPVFIYLVYRYVIPLANVRYLYPLLGVGMVIGFYAAQIISLPRIILKILILICLLASLSELASRAELVSSILLSLLLFFILPLFIGKIRKKVGLGRAVILTSGIFLFIAIIPLERDYRRNEYSRYIKMVKYSGFWPDAIKAWDWLNNNTQTDNIAYAGRPVPFPLYGSGFKNNVYYVSVNKTDPAKLHYFSGSSYRWGYDFLSLHRNLEDRGNYRFGADYSIWLNNLLSRGSDYLFVYSLHQTKETAFPIEDEWAMFHHDKFNPVFANETVHIYRIIK